MDKKHVVKALLILFFVLVSVGGVLAIEVPVYILGYNLRPIVYIYISLIVGALSAIQIARVLEAITEGESPPFLLTTYFRLEDKPKKDVNKDPIAFLGLIFLLLGGYIVRPLAFFYGLLKIIHLWPPRMIRINIAMKLLLSYFLILIVGLSIGLAFIEKRYA